MAHGSKATSDFAREQIAAIQKFHELFKTRSVGKSLASNRTAEPSARLDECGLKIASKMPVNCIRFAHRPTVLADDVDFVPK